MRPRPLSPLSIAVFSFDPPHSACAYYRLLSPLSALGERVSCSWAVRMDAQANIHGVDVACLERADLIIIQRFFPIERTVPVLELIFASGKPVIYETDDFFFDIPDANPAAQLANRAAPDATPPEASESLASESFASVTAASVILPVPEELSSGVL
jgi:processive 1,2-diacylglycerol beta-glucosyltransferase